MDSNVLPDITNPVEVSLCTPPSKKAKFATRDRINSVKLSVLMAAHGQFFAEWSKTRKQATKQLIPKDIWPKVTLTIDNRMVWNNVDFSRSIPSIKANFQIAL